MRVNGKNAGKCVGQHLAQAQHMMHWAMILLSVGFIIMSTYQIFAEGLLCAIVFNIYPAFL